MDTNGRASIQDPDRPMTDYEEQLRFYVEEETREQTASYFGKYWLSKSEYLQKWLPIRETIYDVSGVRFPDVKFQVEFEVLALRGGLIFTEEDFSLLQGCMNETGDRYFVVIEHVEEANPCHADPPLQFRFPTSISWDELLSGGYVSKELFQFGMKEYFVFGDSGTWGKYVANDYIYPLDLIGFQESVSEIFRQHFLPLIEAEVSGWLPDGYQQSGG